MDLVISLSIHTACLQGSVAYLSIFNQQCVYQGSSPQVDQCGLCVSSPAGVMAVACVNFLWNVVQLKRPQENVIVLAQEKRTS